MRKLTHPELLQRQKQASKERLPICVVLNNIRSLYNVGSIFRTADGAGAEKIWLCGITGRPPQAKISKTALGAEQSVPWEYSASAFTVIRALKKKGYRTVFVEQTENAKPYHILVPQGPVCLVLGNEIDGIYESLLPLCDDAVEIEMAGLKNSLNVTVAFGIVAYHLRRGYIGKAAGGDKPRAAGFVDSGGSAVL